MENEAFLVMDEGVLGEGELGGGDKCLYHG